jgi:6-pyruvoyl-tetrahydropterin synthase
MSRKDDIKMLFNFMIDLLKEDEVKNVVEEKIDKKLLVEEPKSKTTNFGSFDPSRIKTIMDKMEAKEHENAVVKQALNVQAKDYKKEIEELREAFNQKVLKEHKLEEDKNIVSTGFSITGATLTRS